MKLIKLILVCFIFCVFICKIVAQEYETITEAEIQIKLQNLQNSTLPDSILYSTIGYFRNAKVRFSQIVENKIYVGEQGIFYRMDFADDFGNITVSCTFFQPHIRFVPLPPEEQDSTYFPPINEHICRCSASYGYAVLEKKGQKFICADKVKSEDGIDNYLVNCEDLMDMQSFAGEYFDTGYSIRANLQILSKREILLLE